MRIFLAFRQERLETDRLVLPHVRVPVDQGGHLAGIDLRFRPEMYALQPPPVHEVEHRQGHREDHQQKPAESLDEPRDVPPGILHGRMPSSRTASWPFFARMAAPAGERTKSMNRRTAAEGLFFVTMKNVLLKGYDRRVMVRTLGIIRHS